MYLYLKKPCSIIQKKKGDIYKKNKNNTGIPDGLKNNFEKISNFNFDNVRVHYNSNMPNKLNALAYTQGDNVYIGSGQEKHLPHELGHVVQQREKRVLPTMKMGVFNINTDETLEKEADSLGYKATQMYGFKILNKKLTQSESLPIQLRAALCPHAIVPQINQVIINAHDLHGIPHVAIAPQVMGAVGQNLPRQDNKFHIDNGNHFISFRVTGAGVAHVQHCGPFGNAVTAQL